MREVLDPCGELNVAAVGVETGDVASGNAVALDLWERLFLVSALISASSCFFTAWLAKTPRQLTIHMFEEAVNTVVLTERSVEVLDTS